MDNETPFDKRFAKDVFTRGCLPILLLGLLDIIISSIWAGYVFSVLWGWFLVPLKLPPVTLPLAIGIMLILKIFLVNHHSEVGKNTDTQKYTKNTESSTLSALNSFKTSSARIMPYQFLLSQFQVTLYWLLGYLLHQIM